MVELFINGGSFMWPILAIFIIGLIFVGERLIHLISTLKWGEAFAGDVTNKLDSSGVLDAQTMCENGNGPISNLLLVGLMNINKGVSGVEKSIDAQANVEMASLEKNMTWIALCIATAPMLGFLGTVWGMVSAFDAIAAADNISAKIVAEGISQALLTTAFGLVVAVILQILQNTVLYIIDNQVVAIQKSVNSLLKSVENFSK
ncbi:MotA/TolQ/ExbB proton channel family protein [bacterium]|jgi:biopolymer transport protein ExbB|nr:MotA/TolQ/ExbB proton channel family protein [bacterium]